MHIINHILIGINLLYRAARCIYWKNSKTITKYHSDFGDGELEV